MHVGAPFSIEIEGEGYSRYARDGRNLVYRTICAFYERIGRAPPSFAPDLAQPHPPDRRPRLELGRDRRRAPGRQRRGRPADGRRRPARARVRARGPRRQRRAGPARRTGRRGRATPAAGRSRSACRSRPSCRRSCSCRRFSMPTKRARQLLPNMVPRRDAVFNAGRTALLVAALQAGRPDLLRVATQDRLHQPYRSRMFPAMPAVIEAALEAGACGACLSGAGSALLALAVDHHTRDRRGDAARGREPRRQGALVRGRHRPIRRGRRGGLATMEIFHLLLGRSVVFFTLICGVWGILAHFGRLPADGRYYSTLVLAELLIVAQALLGLILLDLRPPAERPDPLPLRRAWPSWSCRPRTASRPGAAGRARSPAAWPACSSSGSRSAPSRPPRSASRAYSPTRADRDRAGRPPATSRGSSRTGRAREVLERGAHVRIVLVALELDEEDVLPELRASTAATRSGSGSARAGRRPAAPRAARRPGGGPPG